jgi:hypothetical protein
MAATEISVVVEKGDGNNNRVEDDGDEDTEEADEHCFCTYAVTGTDPTFQAIFLCNECFVDPGDGTAEATTKPEMVNTELSKQQQQQQHTPLCICQACANICHDDAYHDVEYVGMGPSYCDCHRLGNCKLYQKSMEEAARIGMVLSDDQALPLPTTFVQEAFDVPILQKQDENDSSEETFAFLLVEQARELIKHTKETHWIDEAVIQSNTDQSNGTKAVCLLESLAWSIYQSHRDRYSDRIVDDGKGGAEWWVQVKDVSTSKNDNEEEKEGVKKPPLAASSIDLHYDKDEALAESFGVGSFPTLSTVTYLTAPSKTAAPTIVFDHTYTQGEDEIMSSMMVSRPRVGKHICFDGRLLHGAPYHPSLLPSETTDSAEAATGSVFRVTFLVNIWNHRRPASVRVLDDAIRKCILDLPQPKSLLEESQRILRSEDGASTKLTMTPLAIPSVAFDEEETLPKDCQDRIELPFVSNLKGDDDDDDYGLEGSGMVVVTFPPPPMDDCVLVTFGRGLQAYLDYNYGPEVNATEDDGEYDADSCAAEWGGGGGSESRAAEWDEDDFLTSRPSQVSDYV